MQAVKNTHETQIENEINRTEQKVFPNENFQFSLVGKNEMKKQKR